MKKVLFVMLFFVCSLWSKAEQCFFPANSVRCVNAMVFNYRVDEQGKLIQISPDTVYVEKWTGNDTIVDGKECVALWEMYERDLSEYKDVESVIPHVPIFCGVIHEDKDGYVYFKSSDEGSSWEFLYDFSNPDWEVGDKLRMRYDDIEDDWSYITIRQISSCTLCNGEVVSVAENLMYGIGYNDWPFLSPLHDINPYIPVEIPVSFYRGGELLWDNCRKQESDKTFSYRDTWMVHTKDGTDWTFLREEVQIKGMSYRSVMDKEYYYRQDGDKVYRYTMADDKEQVVLDYGLQAGDIFSLCEDFSLQVEAVSDTTIVFMNWDEYIQESISCKRLHLKGVEDPSFQDEWVEMFGSMRYGINPPTKAEDFNQTHLMYAVFGQFIHMCDFNFPNVWGMEAVLGEEHPQNGDGYSAEDLLVFTLRSDTLHIGGYISNDCDGPLYMLVETDSENVILSTYELPLEAECYSFFKIDVSLPGFSQDKYTIRYGKRTFEVTRGDVSIAPMKNEPTASPYYDLLGRKVSHPTRGIYIKDGRKVVVK